MLQERRNKVMELLHDEGIVKVSELMRLLMYPLKPSEGTLNIWRSTAC